MINISSAVNTLSYGNVGTGFVYGLMSSDIPVALFPLNKFQQYEVYPKYQSYVARAIKNAEYFDCNSPSIRIWHQFCLDEFVSKRRIGFPIFELDTFTKLELHHLKSCDEIFIPSKWAQSVLEKYNIKSQVVPLGVDTEIFTPKHIDKDNTVFGLFGKWEIRKSMDLIPELFLKAFPNEKDVELWVMTTNPHLTEAEDLQWKKLYTKLGSRVKFIPYQRYLEDVASVYHAIDCGICISKAEGWNLPLLELMSCGKKNIVTNYSGHTEFANSDNSYLVEIDNLEVAYDGKWFFGQGNWAELGKKQEEQIIHYMRTVYKSEKSINNHCVETGLKFNWKNSARILWELCR